MTSKEQTSLAAPVDRSYPAHPLPAVSLAVFRADDVLIARRARAPAAGAWSLPGGLVELGEALEEAATREMMEEVGVSARVLGFNRFVERIERDAAGRVKHHFIVASFVGLWEAGEPHPSAEALEARWIGPAAYQDEASQRATRQDAVSSTRRPLALDPILRLTLQSAYARLRDLTVKRDRI